MTTIVTTSFERLAAAITILHDEGITNVSSGVVQRMLSAAFDVQHGTPCEQIRHEQERDALNDEIARLRIKVFVSEQSELLALRNNESLRKGREHSVANALQSPTPTPLLQDGEGYERASERVRAEVAKPPSTGVPPDGRPAESSQKPMPMTADELLKYSAKEAAKVGDLAEFEAFLRNHPRQVHPESSAAGWMYEGWQARAALSLAAAESTERAA